jgi:hypothetical protein
MNMKEAVHLASDGMEAGRRACKLLASQCPPNKKTLAKAEALFDQANAGIRGFLEAVKKIDDRQFPELRDFKKLCKVSLVRHIRALRLVKELIS